MRLILLAMLTLCFSCGKNSNSSQEPNRDKRSEYICAGRYGILSSLCMARVDWFINTEAKDFPVEYSISLYGHEVVDSCTEKDRVLKTIENDRFTIALPDFRFPYSDIPLELVITDRGSDCSIRKPFYSNKNTSYSKNEVTIDDGKYFEIYVDL